MMPYVRHLHLLPKRGIHLVGRRLGHSTSLGSAANHHRGNPDRDHSIKRLQDNLKWLPDVRDVRRYVGRESNLTLCNKLDALAHMERCPATAPTERVLVHMARILSILEQLLPLMSESSVDFRQNYVAGTPFVQYAVDMMARHHGVLSKDMLMTSISFVSSISSPSHCDVMMNLIKSLRQIPDTLGACIDNCNNLLLLLHNHGDGSIPQELYDLSTDVLFDSIVAGIDVMLVGASLSIQHILSQHYPDDGYVGELTVLYLREVKHHIYALDTATLLNILQFIYRCAHIDDELYTSTMESLLYKYDFMTHDEKSTLVLLLPFLKHMCLLRTPNISTNVYSEECQMLNAMLRREFEHVIMHMPFDGMVTHCLALSLMFKQSSVIRKLLLRCIDSSFVDTLDAQGFLKLLSCCNTLHITSSSIEVSRLLSKCAHTKLADCNGPDLLLAFKSLSQITARRHRKYLVPLVQDALVKNKSDYASLIECLHLFASLNMQRINANVLESGFELLFPHLKNHRSDDAGDRDAAVEISRSEPVNRITADSHLPSRERPVGDPTYYPTDQSSIVAAQSSMMDSPGKGNNIRGRKDSDVLYIEASATVANAIPLHGLCRLLECLTKMELGLERLVPLFSLVQTSILAKVKYNSSVGIAELSGILKSLTESRVVYTDLADTILERVYNCPELLDDVESAAVILQFIEFTNHGEYPSKLSKPLFEFCLRKPTLVLMEVLEYQRYKRPEFYTAYMDLMHPPPPEIPDGSGGIVEHTAVLPNDCATTMGAMPLSRPTGGKKHHLLSQWLSEHPKGQEFEEFHKTGNLVVDFFHRQLRTAVLILRSQDCYCVLPGEGEPHSSLECHGIVHLKGRMWLIREILRLQGVRVVLIPERVLIDGGTLPNHLSQAIDV